MTEPDHRIAALDARLTGMTSDLRAYGCDVHVSRAIPAGMVYVCDLSMLHADTEVQQDGSIRFRVYCSSGDEPVVRASLAQITGVGDPPG